MKLHESGIIVFTRQFEEMVLFYRDLLKLPVRAVTPIFCAFHFGYSYLLIEPFVPGHAVQSTDLGPPPHVLRLNVFDFEESVQELMERGVETHVEHFEWGSVATIRDPDGNVLELKDAPDFFD